MWESEFCYLWQQRTCHCVCSLVYIYITAPKSKADWSLWLRISANPVHVSCHIHSTWPSHSISFLSSIILIISSGKYNLWSYTLCSFIQFPVTFSHKSLRTDQHCAQSTVYSQCHRPSVTPTSIKILHKHTRLYFNQHAFRKQEGEQNILRL